MTHIDPVCGMDVEEDTPFKSTQDGRTIYFCSESCKQEFDANPKQYKQ
jgi:YHS domain-containing protein